MARPRKARPRDAFTVRVNARRRVDAYGDRGGRALPLLLVLLSALPFHPLSASMNTHAPHTETFTCVYIQDVSTSLATRRAASPPRIGNTIGSISFIGPTWRRFLAYGKAMVLDRPPSYEGPEIKVSFLSFSKYDVGESERANGVLCSINLSAGLHLGGIFIPTLHLSE